MDQICSYKLFPSGKAFNLVLMAQYLKVEAH